jgi:hypothetical protein
MTHDDVHSAGIARDQAESLIGHLDAVATQLERQVAALEGAAAEPNCRTRPRLLADARIRREELSEARAHIDVLRGVAYRKGQDTPAP